MDRPPGTLSVGEWAVLARRRASRPRFCRRPGARAGRGRRTRLVDTAAARLPGDRHAAGQGARRGARPRAGRPGTPRTILGPTPPGRRLLGRWLAEPVEHVRDVRSLLLLKLSFSSGRAATRRPSSTLSRSCSRRWPGPSSSRRGPHRASTGRSPGGGRNPQALSSLPRPREEGRTVEI